jgi:hypothetical protein
MAHLDRAFCTSACSMRPRNNSDESSKAKTKAYGRVRVDHAGTIPPRCGHFYAQSQTRFYKAAHEGLQQLRKKAEVYAPGWR